jgi:MFS family permease
VEPSVGETQLRYYGWVVVVVAFFLFSLCFGGLVLVGVLIKPWADTFGWQRGEISGAYLIATLSLATGGVAFGRLSDRCSLRLLATLGAIAISASLLLLSVISALWQVYVLFALYGALGMGTIYIPLTASITHWFSSNRGIAVAAAMSGAAIGMGIVPGRQRTDRNPWMANRAFLYWPWLSRDFTSPHPLDQKSSSRATRSLQRP